MESEEPSQESATEPSPKTRASRPGRGRNRWLAGAAALLVLGVLGAYHRHALADLSKSDFADVQLTGRMVLQKGSTKPFSGTLLVRDGDIAALGAAIFAGTPVEQWTGADPLGLILEVSVVDGKLAGGADLYADLRSPELAGQLGSGLGFTLAKWFSPRQKVAMAHFADGKLEGRSAVWRPVGSELTLRKLVDAEFAGNQLHGKTRRFYPDGKVQVEMHFDSGSPAGVHKEFYASGEVEREIQYEGSKRDRKAYYRNGQLRTHDIEEDGMPIASEGWFPDGSQRRTAAFANGRTTSEQRWFSNGQLEFEWEEFGPVEHPPNGTIRTFYDSGNLHSEHQYVDGVLHGPFKKFYDNEQMWEEGTYARGELDGAHRKWWKHGGKALESSWQHGRQHGTLQRWYASGQLWEQANYEAGKRVGPYRKHWMNGKVAHDYQYVDGRPEGRYATFYDNGQARLEASYSAGKLHGDYKNWLKDGSVYELATYESGKKVTSSRQE